MTDKRNKQLIREWRGLLERDYPSYVDETKLLCDLALAGLEAGERVDLKGAFNPAIGNHYPVTPPRRAATVRVENDPEWLAVGDAIQQAFAPDSKREEAGKEPVYKTVERILDEESAWIARPSKEVTRRIAFAATVAAHAIVEKQQAAAPTPPASDLVERLKSGETHLRISWEAAAEILKLQERVVELEREIKFLNHEMDNAVPAIREELTAAKQENERLKSELDGTKRGERNKRS